MVEEAEEVEMVEEGRLRRLKRLKGVSAYWLRLGCPGQFPQCLAGNRCRNSITASLYRLYLVF